MNLSVKTPTQPTAAAGAPAVAALELWGEPTNSFGSRIPDGREILSFLRRNAIWIVSVACVVAVLCVIAVRLLFNQYVATATVLFDPRDAKVTGAQEVLSDIGPDSIAIESLVQVAKSDGFLTALVEHEGLSKDPEFGGSAATGAEQNAAALEKLRDRLTIARRGQTYVVDVSAKTGDAQKSARIANAAASMIVDNESDLRASSNQHAVDFISGKLAQLRDRVSAEDSAIAKLRTDLKITDAGQGEVLQERRVTELNQQFALATAHSGEAKALVDQLREANFTAAGALPSVIQSPVLSSLRQDYARLTRQAADRETVLGARHPDVVAANAQIEDIRRQIGAEKDRLIASAKADYLEARKREASLAEEVRKAQAESGATDQEAVQLRELERNEKSDQAVYEQMLNRQKELSEIKGLTSNDVRVASPALAPTRTNMPKLSLVLAASGLIGLLAGLASAFARDPLQPSPLTPADVQRQFGVEANTILPTFSPAPPFDGRPAGGEARRWFERLCASARVQRARRGGVILVTSALGGEGKSTVAGNVAACLAAGGSDVLLMQLVEGDKAASRRRPGVIEVASEKYSLERAVRWRGKDSPGILSFGGSGVADRAGLDALLASAPFRRVIHRCRRRFDTLVIDAPSILEAPALREMASLVDATLLIVEWSKMDAATIAKAVEDLDRGKVSVVFNKVDLARYAEIAPGSANLTSNPIVFTNVEPIERAQRGSDPADRAEWTRRTGRRRSAFGRAG